MNSTESAFVQASDLIHTLLNQSELNDRLKIGGIHYLDVIAPFLIYAGFADAIDRHQKKAQPAPVTPRLKLWLKANAFLGSLSLMREGPAAGNEQPHEPEQSALLLGYTGYFTREILLPLRSHLNSQKTFSPVLVTDKVWRGFPQKGQEGSAISIWNSWNPCATRMLGSLLLDLEYAQEHIASQGILEDAINNVDPTLVPYILPHWTNALYWTLPKLAAYHALATTLLSNLSPSILVNSDVCDFRTRIFEVVAQQSRIPSLGIQFGVYGPNDTEWRFLRSDHLAVTGEKNYNYMLHHQISMDRMTITGSPRFDAITAQFEETTNAYRQKQESHTSKRIRIVFASQPYYYGAFTSPSARLTMIESFLQAIKGFSDIELVFKPHPVENTKELKALLASHKNIVVASPQDDIRRLTAEADAFVTFFSGSAFEALAWGKPVMNLCFPNSYVDKIFVESNATYLAKNQEEIVEFLNILRRGEAKYRDNALPSARHGWSFLNSWFECSKGVPSGNISRLMENISRRAIV